jgi:hypothetical protein
MRFLPSALLSALALLLLSPGARAQIRASEPASFSQTIDGTTVRIDYYRPRTRGRSPIFGHGSVVWERIWTPGANWATKLSFQKPIEIDGVPVEPGTYSLWFEMDEEDFLPHEFFLEPDTLIYHTMGPPRADDQIRFPVTLESDAPFREVLTWDFDDIRSDGGTLALRWGTHRIAFDVEVEPSMRITTTEEEAALALGDFEGSFVDPESGQAGPSFGLRIFWDDEGILHADWHDVEPMPQDTHEFFNNLDMWLLPGGAEGWFIPGESYEPGVLRETWAGYFLEFEVVDGEGQSFLMRDDLDQIIMRGNRVSTP